MTGSATLPGHEQDIAHRLDRAQVVGIDRDGQGPEKVVKGKTIAALAPHGSDLDQQLSGSLADGIGALANELPGYGRVDRTDEMDCMHCHLNELPSQRVNEGAQCRLLPSPGAPCLSKYDQGQSS